MEKNKLTFDANNVARVNGNLSFTIEHDRGVHDRVYVVFCSHSYFGSRKLGRVFSLELAQGLANLEYQNLLASESTQNFEVVNE